MIDNLGDPRLWLQVPFRGRRLSNIHNTYYRRLLYVLTYLGNLACATNEMEMRRFRDECDDALDIPSSSGTASFPIKSPPCLNKSREYPKREPNDSCHNVLA
jgi:hypothetical protein